MITLNTVSDSLDRVFDHVITSSNQMMWFCC